MRWQISVRADGKCLCAGAVPTLIEWGDVHPSDSLPPSGVKLGNLSLGGLPAILADLSTQPLMVDRSHDPGPPLRLALVTPRGPVTLDSLHLET